MQVLLIAIGSHGDVLPFIALGVELRRRGHSVVLAAPAPFEAPTTRAGLQFHALLDQAAYDAVIADPDLWRPRRGAQIMFELAASFIDPVYSFIAARVAEGPMIVVASVMSWGARVAQDKFGLSLVTVHPAPLLLRSRHAPPELPGLPLPRWLPAQLRHRIHLGAEHYLIDPVCLPPLNAYRANLGLPPVEKLRSWCNSPLRVILMFPEWFAPAPPDWPPQALQTGFPRADSYGGTAELGQALGAFLDAGEAPLVFAYGSAMRQSRWFFDAAIRICLRMGMRGVFLAPQQDQMPGELPAGMIHVPYAPLSRLLPRCAALIHHGGIGTVAQGLGAGVPQLIVPVAFDHFDEGGRIERLGVGQSLRRTRFTPRGAAQRLRRLLASASAAAACASARQRVTDQTDAALTAADDVERLIRIA